MYKDSKKNKKYNNYNLIIFIFNYIVHEVELTFKSTSFRTCGRFLFGCLLDFKEVRYRDGNYVWLCTQHLLQRGLFAR